MVWYSTFKVEKTKPGVVADACHPSSWEAKSRPAWTVSETHLRKTKTIKFVSAYLVCHGVGVVLNADTLSLGSF